MLYQDIIASFKNSEKFRIAGRKALTSSKTQDICLYITSIAQNQKQIMDEVEQKIVTPDGSFNVDIHICMVDPDKLIHFYLSSD